MTTDVQPIHPLHITFPPLLDHIQHAMFELYCTELFVAQHVHLNPADILALEVNLLSYGLLRQIVDTATGKLVDVVRNANIPAGTIGIVGEHSDGVGGLEYRQITLTV